MSAHCTKLKIQRGHKAQSSPFKWFFIKKLYWYEGALVTAGCFASSARINYTNASTEDRRFWQLQLYQHRQCFAVLTSVLQPLWRVISVAHCNLQTLSVSESRSRSTKASHSFSRQGQSKPNKARIYIFGTSNCPTCIHFMQLLLLSKLWAAARGWLRSYHMSEGCVG